MTAPNDLVLDVQHLTTTFRVGRRSVCAVDDVSLQLRRGETLGLVGESGCGKSVTVYSIVRLVQAPGRIERGRVLFLGRDLLALPEREMRKVRGAGIGFVFQEPVAALNPVFTVGDQLAEAMEVHATSRADARRRAIELLEAVKIPDAARRARDYPHQLSGGMCQRVLIALAIACRPALLIADEPTTALDMTVQAQILDLLREMRDALQLSVLLVTHDLGVVARIADRVAVMYAGRIVEEGPVRGVYGSPAHPYTRALLAAMRPGPDGRREAIDGAVPALGASGRGCAFAPRCRYRLAECDQAPPPAVAIDGGRVVRCFLHPPADAAPPR